MKGANCSGFGGEPEFLGEKNAVKVRSPSPFVRSCSSEKAGSEVPGKMVRVVRFQFSLIEIGHTGWMLRIF